MRKWINELRDSVKIINHDKVSSKLIAVCEALNTLDDTRFNIQHYKMKEGNVATYCPLGWVVKKVPSLGLRFCEKNDFEGSYSIRNYDGETGIDAVIGSLGISLFDYVDVFSEYGYHKQMAKGNMPTKEYVLSKVFDLAMSYRALENE